MKRAQFLSLVGVSLAIGFIAISPARAQQQPLPVQPAPSSSQNSSTQAPTNAQQRADLVRKRAEWFQKQRAYPNQRIPAAALQKAIEQRDQMIQQQRSGVHLAAPGIISFPGDGVWHPMGPQPTDVPALFGSFPSFDNVGFPTVSGRVTALAADPSDPTGQTVYLGAAAGGVWKTTDGGAHWIPLTDNQPSLAVGSIAIDPSHNQTVYVGTGEENFNLDSYYGAGILKSTDGGTTWNLTCSTVGASCPFFGGPLASPFGGTFVGTIAVQPGSTNVLLAAMTSRIVGAGGIFRSTDGGATWTQVIAGLAGTDVVFDPGTPLNAYAAMGWLGGDTPNGIYKSTDGGATWTLLGGGLPASNIGRIKLGFAPSTTGNTATVYAAIADSSDNSSLLLTPGFFLTNNGGSTWAAVPNTPDFCAEPGGTSGQCFYDMAIAVHPSNAGFVVVGGAAYLDNSTTLFRATGANTATPTWTTCSVNPCNNPNGTSTASTDFTIGSTNVRPHVDTHVLLFAPNGVTPRLYTGDDGGPWRTDNPGVTSPNDNPQWVDLNGTLAITQFYPGTMPSIGDENYGFGGTQDNDIQVFSGTLDWNMAPACGDGGYIAIDPNTPTTIYAGCDEFAAAKVMQSVFYGQLAPGPVPTPVPSFQPAETAITASGDTMGFIPPLIIEQFGSLLFGTCQIWQGSVGFNGPITWTAAGLDLTNGNFLLPGTPCADQDSISTIDAARDNSGNVFAGTSNGKVWLSSSFSEIDNGLLPKRYVTAVRSKPSDSTHVYVTFSGFGTCLGCDGKGHVFKSMNATAGPTTTWVDISGNLPDAPVNDIFVDHGGNSTFDALYIATDVGVFSCPDPEAATPCTNWTVVGDGLPNAPVLSLGMRSNSRILRAGTHGRSMFDIQLRDEQPGPLPSLSSLTPAAVFAMQSSAPATTVTVTGLNFSPNTQVLVDNFVPAGMTTTVVSTTQITVTVPASQLTSGTVHQVGLSDPLGADTGKLPFTVMNVIPNVTGESGTSGTIGEPVPITITGTGFVDGTTLTITQGAVTLTENFGNVTGGGTQDVITIPDSESALLTAGSATVMVSNPLPGGGFALNPDFSTFHFTLTMSSNPNAEISFSSPFASFSGTNPGTTNATTVNVQLTNNSNAGKSLTLTASSAVKSGANAGDFSIVAPTSGSPVCIFAPTGTQTTLAVGGSCWFGLTFTVPSGTAPGFVGASLSVSDNDADTDTESLSISGLVNGLITSPEFFTSNGNICLISGCFPTPVNFGSVPKGVASEIDGTLENAGNVALTGATLTILPSANSTDFAIVSPSGSAPATACSPLQGPFGLPAAPALGRLCSVGITFTPKLSGTQENATLEITFTNAGLGKIDVPLSGIGVVPTIDSISPEIVATGGPTFALTVNGRNYVLGSVVNLNGNARLTTFVDATKLLASIPASDLTTAGSSAITVTNPAGGGTSEPKTLIVAQAPTGTNDDFADATTAMNPIAPPFPFRTTQDTTKFTTNTGGNADPAPACAPGTATLSGKARSAWFKFIAPASGRVVADTRYSSYTTILSVWTGTAGSLTTVAGACASGNILSTPAESFVGFNVTNGTTYFLMVTDASASGVGGTLTFRLDFASAPPANDDWANATVITPAQAATPYSDSVNSIPATINTGGHVDPTPLCAPAGAANGGIANSVWYSLTPTSTTPVTADTLTSLDDTILSVWTGTPGAFTQVACNDNAGTGPTQVLQSQVSFTATGGTTYYFMISSVLGDGGTAFHLRLTAATSATLTSIAVTPANPSVAAGKTQQFTATGTFSDSSTQDVTNSVLWASGTPANATINAAGLATAVKVGTSTISATSGAVVGSTTLTVTAATLSSIAVTPANPSVAAGKTQQFTATGMFSDSSTQNLTGSVTWASGTLANATINTAGLATAVKVGTSTISATSGAVVGSTTLTVTAATLSSIAVTPANPSVAAGKTQQFTATGTFSDSSTQNLTGSVTWASGTPANATINTAGLATAVKVGTSTISATSGAVVGSTTLTVTAATLSSIAVTPANPSVAAGKTQQFTATGMFSDSSTQNLTGSVTWASGTLANATINTAGLATAVKVGTSTISATSGAVVGSTTLTVTAATLSSIAVTPANPSVAAGKTQQFTATGTFSDNSTQNLTGSVTWASGTPANATINAAGLATAVKVGTSTISATSGAVVGSTTLTVTAATLSSIAVTPATPTIIVAGTQQFTATGTFSDNSTQNLTGSVTWASGTTTVATINASGLATAVKAGTSTISATSGAVVGSTTLTVTNASLVSIAVTPANPSVAAGKTQQFTATGTFSDSSTQNITSTVTWSSSDTTIATINATGLATGVKLGGPVTIKAASGSVNGTTTFTVTAAVLSSIAVTPANPSLAAGKTQQFTATGTFSDNSTQDLTGSVTWASGTPANATINATGLATAVKVGTSTITATSGAVVGSTTLTVTAATLSSIAVTPTNPSIPAGKTQQFTATGTFSDSSTKDLTSTATWASGTTTIATINAAGLATTLKIGTSTISATSGGVVGSTTLTVTAAVLSSIAVTPANPSISVGNTQQFTATGTFSDNSTQDLTSTATWASGTPANATINAAGLATAVKAGISTISATSGSVVGSTTLTVTAPPAVTTNPANQTVNAGSSVTFTAAASGSPAPTVQWQVSVSGGTFSNVPNATSTTLTFTTTFSQNGNKYQAVFTNSVGTATTTAATLTVTAPDVTISKTHPVDFVVGSSPNNAYTIKVTNTGTGPTTGNVTVTDNLPAVLAFVSGSGANWSCTATGQAVTCTYSGPALAAAGGNSTVTLTVSVAPGAFPSVTNTATVTDPNDSKSTDKLSLADVTNIDNAVPTQSSFSPSAGLIVGTGVTPQQITLTGTGFNSSTQVTLGSNAALTGTANAAGTSLTITVPAGDLANAGTVTISVFNPPNPTSSAGGGKAATTLNFPLVAFVAAQDASTPGTIAVTAGTPAMVKIDYTTNPANSPLPAALTVTCTVPQSLTSATCAVNGGTIAAGATSGSATITINAIPTSSGTSTSTPWTGGRGPWPTYLLWLVAAVLLSMLGMFGAVRQRTLPLRRAPAYLALVVLVLAAGALVGCTTTAKTTPTPTGPASIMVTATTADGASVTTTVNITVSN